MPLSHQGMGRLMCPNGTCFLAIGRYSVGYITDNGESYFIRYDDAVVWLNCGASARQRRKYRMYYNTFIKLFNPKMIDAGTFKAAFHTNVDESVKKTYKFYRIKTWRTKNLRAMIGAAKTQW